MSDTSIQVRGASEHNLKSVDLDLPKNKLITFTGVSGSGKSSMAFDTLFAEGQRRYVESLSAYARQFLGQMDKPRYESIKGLSPTISIEQKTTSKNPRSTVGTITEIYDYLRVLYARIGEQFCYQCHGPVQAQSPQEMINDILSLEKGIRFMLLAPLIENRKGSHTEIFDQIRREGFVRIRVNGQILLLDEDFTLNPKKRNQVELVIDRLVAKEGIDARVADSVETALKWGKGYMSLLTLPKGEDSHVHLYSQSRTCLKCKISFPELSPQSFSFNSPLGMCEVCNGLGTAFEMDPKKLIPDPSLALSQGAVKPWKNPRGNHSIRWALKVMDAVMSRHSISNKIPFQDLKASEQEILLYGDPEPLTLKLSNRRGTRKTFTSTWEGIVPMMLRRWKETESEETRQRYAQYLSDSPCHQCNGHRLRRESAAVKVGKYTLPEFNDLTIAYAYQSLNTIQLSKRQHTIAGELLKEISHRLRFLNHVGLTYLSLNRPGPTLSGGESQRIRLASQMGSELTGVLYILDEPSIGLHARDNARLIETLCHLRDLGNSVIVVEHDPELMRVCDHIVDFGPRAGALGGEIVVAGSYQTVIECKESLTGAYLSGAKNIPIPSKKEPDHRWLEIVQAHANNLKNVNVKLPVGLFTCITGVSGAGKSSLIGQIIHPAAHHLLNQGGGKKKKVPFDLNSLPCKEIKGFEHFDKCVHIDQSPIGRTPRSNPATYTKVWDEIRSVFAQMPESKAYGFKAGRFSFNIAGGRCEACKGAGVTQVPMHFLADVYVECDVCQGKRFNEATLRVTYQGKTINDILQTPIDEAADLFSKHPKVSRILKTLQAVGLGYLTLGQSSTTLSGGEAQRIKLSRELAKRSTGKTLYILDEPSTGLHSEDIRNLLEVIQTLKQGGNTLIMIEHNLEIIQTADWIIDLGPEGGDAGGEVVFAGPVEQIIKKRKSYTGQFLKKIHSNHSNHSKATSPNQKRKKRGSKNKTPS